VQSGAIQSQADFPVSWEFAGIYVKLTLAALLHAEAIGQRSAIPPKKCCKKITGNFLRVTGNSNTWPGTFP
jgi:hypothetical protein